MRRTLGIALLFTIIYVLIFSLPLKKELVFKPRWVQDLTHPSKIAKSATSEAIGFRIGQVFGYATPQGAVEYLNTTPFNVAMTDKYFINFSSVSQDLVEKDRSGRITRTVASRGYPIFLANRFFIIDTDRRAISERDGQGETLWRRDFGSLVTSMAANASEVVVGLMNGSIVVVGKRGRVSFRYAPGGSKIPIVYGCAISQNGDYLALVSGLDPQKFILLARAKSGYRPRRIVTLDTPQRNEVFIHFYPGVPYVYVESSGAVDYFALLGNRSGRIPVDGRIVGMSNGNNAVIYAVSAAISSPGKDSSSRLAELTAFAPAGNVLMRTRFPAGQLFVKAQGDSVYLGAETSLMRIDYVHE